MDYFSEYQSSSLYIKDKTYDKLIGHLDEFVKSLPEEKDKQLLIKTISKCYLKYQDSLIKGDGNSIWELIIKLLMAMLLGQKTQYDKL